MAETKRARCGCDSAERLTEARTRLGFTSSFALLGCVRDVVWERFSRTCYMALLLANGGGKGGRYRSSCPEVTTAPKTIRRLHQASPRALSDHWRQS